MTDRTTVFKIFDHFSEDGHFFLLDDWSDIEGDRQGENLREIFPRITIEKDGVLKEHLRFYACRAGEFFQGEEKSWLNRFDSILRYSVRESGYEYTGKHIADSYMVVVFDWDDDKGGRLAVPCGIVDPAVDLMNTCIALTSSKNFAKVPPGCYGFFTLTFGSRILNGESWWPDIKNDFTDIIKHIERCLNSSLRTVRWVFDYKSSVLKDNLENIVKYEDIKRYFPSMCGGKKH